MMVPDWRVSDRKSQVSKTLLSILADPNNAEVWRVSIHPLIFNSNPTNHTVIVLSAPVTIFLVSLPHSCFIDRLVL